LGFQQQLQGWMDKYSERRHWIQILGKPYLRKF
jgi:hypothetical protein